MYTMESGAPAASMVMANMMRDTTVLVAAVKEAQRSDPVARQQWGFFCTAEGGGVRDPTKHQAEFLQKFLEAYQNGTLSYGGAHANGDPNELVTIVKIAQKTSKVFGNAWKAYCATYGRGVNDPLKHDYDYLRGFLDYMGDQGQMALTVATSFGGMGPPAKKQKTGLGWPPNEMPADPAKEPLVQRIKNFQRTGEPAKELWWAHCDTILHGVRDPARHSAEVLQQFLDANQIP
eukprot:TRINITY_DN23948_c0_g1_i1.p1 TRINITY_DN23948_c0_g1~~TRINITY_DN23948_c0_g1_i1.p1  ORF type:complete len:233 (-),score=38.66 TRINITY_DN23948_c0_g1_i1:197-895(-)